MEANFRYQVFVTEAGKGRELVDSFQSLNEAQKMVHRYKLNRDNHIKQQDELSYHYKNLDWEIVDMGGGNE